MLSNRFDFLEIAHRIGMTTEVNLLSLHIIPLTYQMQILCKGCVFLSAQSDFSAALQKISQKWCLLFQVRNFLQQFRVFFIFVTQLHHNIVVDFRKRIFQSGWKNEAYEVPASWSDHPVGQHPSAGLSCLPWSVLRRCSTLCISHAVHKCEEWDDENLHAFRHIPFHCL